MVIAGQLPGCTTGDCLAIFAKPDRKINMLPVSWDFIPRH
jgi:hypothetical protein